MTNESSNPYESPTDVGGVAATKLRGGVYRYSELPRSCPQCSHRFSDVYYRRQFPRRFRWSTIAFIIFVCMGAIGLLGQLALVVIVPMGGWALTWHKKVRVRCASCGWGQKFIVSGRG